jgi:anti-sigma regulatory factor (Ser/Thr protein kinase)
MSELRRAIRAATFAHPSPQSALDAVDAIAASQNLGLATAIVGYLDPTQSVMEYASAGHPAPIFLTARGRAFPLLGGGTLLGLGIGCASPPRSVTLSPGTSLVLYTDGLIEYSRDIDAGEAKLIESIEALGARGMLVGRTLHDVVLEGDPRDDCATLIVGRLPAQESATERYSFTAVPASARLLRDAIRDFTGRCEIEGDREFAVLMAAGEAIANGIEHGSQEPGSTIAVEIAYDGATLSLEIESRGHWRSSASEHRGRGIGIMRSCAQRFQLSSSSERTRVSLAF